ncbi:DUF488 domain-containing protein [Mesorhizobium sp. CA8]|uniref:DUF488 domain-containing protein n=1 Tax=Mesorhizobium sp. CA8 TaxID=2876637 RepID=UPI001CCD80A5|nr:DUF488 domain-containing protein [Mesorhizobium sp. CA8]MBZ9764222.1 DUF488 domain-containing protein [Mesorhizobium sp. CA8]
MHSKQSTNRSHIPFFTVGHSNRKIEEFIDILRQGRIGIVVDVRRLPGSRAYPQFDSERLAASLAEAQIAYEIVVPLGGRRGKVDAVPPETNGAWRNQSFHNYADYAFSAEFRSGLDRLLALRPRRCAMMCSEAVWWRCHRRIIADYLLAHGEEVFHLMGNGRVEKAVPTAGAVLRDDGSVIYPAAATTI